MAPVLNFGDAQHADRRQVISAGSIEPRGTEIDFSSGGVVSVIVLLAFAIAFVAACCVWCCRGFYKDYWADKRRKIDKQFDHAYKYKEHMLTQQSLLQQNREDQTWSIPQPPQSKERQEFHYGPPSVPPAVGGYARGGRGPDERHGRGHQVEKGQWR